MRRECRERFPLHRQQRKPLVSDPDMPHGTCVTHVPWCMAGSLTSGDGENVPGIPGACATRNFTYLVRGPCYLGKSFRELFEDKMSPIGSPLCSDMIHYFQRNVWGCTMLGTPVVSIFFICHTRRSSKTQQCWKIYFIFAVLYVQSIFEFHP